MGSVRSSGAMGTSELCIVNFCVQVQYVCTRGAGLFFRVAPFSFLYFSFVLLACRGVYVAKECGLVEELFLPSKLPWTCTWTRIE